MSAPRRIAVLGGGGVGSYVGGYLSTIADVTIVDGWAEHVREIQTHGLEIEDANGCRILHPAALNLHDVGKLLRDPPDLALVCVKSYDTAWAVELIRPYISATGYFVTLQNGINEEEIAQRVGWGRILGTVVSGIGVNTTSPGRVVRSVSRPAQQPVFRVGEMNGLATTRALAVAKLLGAVDLTIVTNNLWCERWEKLATNCMLNAPCALLDIGTISLISDRHFHPFLAAVGGETLDVAAALGFGIESVLGFSRSTLGAVLQGDSEANLQFQRKLAAMAANATDSSLPSTAQDVKKGRRTEIDALNGYVCLKGQQAGVPTPANDFITSAIRDVDRGRASAGEGQFWSALVEWKEHS
jgi:2-dehydropantoate 2-reductase